MVSPVDHALRPGLPDFLDDGGVVHGAGRDPFEKDDLRRFFGLDEFLRVFGQALPVVALVMKDGDLFQLQPAHGKIHFQPGLGVVRGDGAEEAGVLPALGQFRVRRGGRHGDQPGVLVDAQGRLGGPAADVPHDDVRLSGDQLGGGVRRHFRLAGVVLDEEFDFLPQDAAPGVDVLDHQFGGLDGRQAVGRQIAAVRAGDAELDRVRGQGRSSRCKGDEQGRQQDMERPCKCEFFHRALLLRFEKNFL